MWGLLADLRLVEHGDELVVKDLLTGNLTIRPVDHPACCELAAIKKRLICNLLI
jgi:hypothetical protein